MSRPPEKRRHHSGWLERGRRRWDLPPNVTKLLLALIPLLTALVVQGRM